MPAPAPTRWQQLEFWVWVAVGGALVIAAWWNAEFCRDRELFIDLQTKQLAPESQAVVHAEKMMYALSLCSLPYALFGVILFGDRGNHVFGIAGAVIAFAALAVVHGNWIDL